MTEKTLNVLSKTFLLFCFFVSPLIFLTDFSRSPYIVQNAFLVLGAFGALFVFILYAVLKKADSFAVSKADIALLIFIFIALVSVAINYFISPTPQALLNEFFRRGHPLITNMFCAYFLARFICNGICLKESSEPAEDTEKDNYKIGFLILIWGCFWLPFSYFRMKGLFDFYGILMWAGGIYIAGRFITKITAKNIFDVLLAVGALSCAYGICQNLGFEFLWPFDISKDFGSRSISTFGNPNFLSSFVLLVLPLGFIYFLSAKEKFAKVYYFLLCLLYIICLALTQTRSSWLGALLAGIILLSSKTFRNLVLQNKRSFILLLIISAALFFLWPSEQKEGYKSLVLERTRQESIISPSDLTLAVKEDALNQSYHQRLMMWTCGVDNFKQKPWLGWGWGSWQLSFAPCQGKLLNKYPALSVLKTQANAAHNIFVETLTQSGIIGLLCFCAFLFFVLWGFRACKIKEKETAKKLFYLALLASFIAFLTDNLLNITSQITVLAFMFYFSIGVLASLSTKKVKIRKIYFVICLVALGILLMFFNIKNYKDLLSNYYSFKAYKEVLANRNYPAAALLDKALKLSDYNAEDYYLQVSVLVNLKDYSNLNSVLDKSLKLFPYFYEFYFRKAALTEVEGKTQEALSYVKKTLSLYPAYEPALGGFLNLLTSNADLRTLENARFIETMQISLSFSSASNFLLAQIYFEHGLYGKAREILLRELSSNVFNETAQKRLGEVNKKLLIKEDTVLQQAEELTALRKEIISAAKINSSLMERLKKAAQSQDLEAQMLLAQAYFKNNNLSASREILENLYKTYEDFLPLNFALASLEEAAKNKEQAKKYLQHILLKDSNNQLALRRLQSLY